MLRLMYWLVGNEMMIEKECRLTMSSLACKCSEHVLHEEIVGIAEGWISARYGIECRFYFLPAYHTGPGLAYRPWGLICTSYSCTTSNEPAVSNQNPREERSCINLWPEWRGLQSDAYFRHCLCGAFVHSVLGTTAITARESHLKR